MHNKVFQSKNIKTARLEELINLEGMPPIHSDEKDRRRKKKMKRLNGALRSKDVQKLIDIQEEF